MSTRLEAALAELAEAIREEVRAEADTHARAPDRLLSVDGAAEALGLGRSLLYAEIAAGRLRSVTVGRRRLIPAAAIGEFIATRTPAPVSETTGSGRGGRRGRHHADPAAA
jgi:excisionase family DNA binding protein